MKLTKVGVGVNSTCETIFFSVREVVAQNLAQPDFIFLLIDLENAFSKVSFAVFFIFVKNFLPEAFNSFYYCSGNKTMLGCPN